MLPRAAAVSILAAGSITAILGGGYLLQQGGAVETTDILDEATEPPAPPPDDTVPPATTPDSPVVTAAPSTKAPGKAPAAASGSGGGASGAASAGGGGAGAEKPPSAPPAPRSKPQSTIDRIIESLGRNTPSPGAPAPAPPPVPPTAGGAAGGSPPPAAPADPPVPAENYGPTANPRERYREVIVPAGQIVEVVLTKDLSSKEAQAETPIEARITRSYRVGDELAIPENTRLVGLVTAVEQQGSIKGRGRIDFRFYNLRLPDGSTVAIETPLQRYEGPAPAGSTAKKAGGAAVGGAVVGILLGGTAGAVKGAAAGAAAATASSVGKEPEPVVIPANVPFDLRIVSSVRVHVPIKNPA